MLVEEGGGADEVECYSVWAVLFKSYQHGFSLETNGCGGWREGKYIFMASSCSFLGIISSMCGARRG